MRTGRKNQQAMFLENLWREMDKISSSNTGSISVVASRYMSEGYDLSEIAELLVSDGFDQSDAKHCVANMTDLDACEDTSDTNLPEWGFEAEDHQRGDIVSNFDVECPMIKADSEETAWEKAQLFLDEKCDGNYSVTKVNRL